MPGVIATLIRHFGGVGNVKMRFKPIMISWFPYHCMRSGYGSHSADGNKKEKNGGDGLWDFHPVSGSPLLRCIGWQEHFACTSVMFCQWVLKLRGSVCPFTSNVTMCCLFVWWAIMTMLINFDLSANEKRQILTQNAQVVPQSSPAYVLSLRLGATRISVWIRD